MKTPSLLSVSIRAFVLAFVLMLVASPRGRAETLLLQLPISRATHSFSLWEVNPSDYAYSESDVERDGIPILGMPAGWYHFIGAVPFGLTAGSFDNQGVWQATNASFLSATVEREFGGNLFFIHDDSTDEGAQIGRMNLADAAWFSISNGMSSLFLGIPETLGGATLHSDIFVLHAWFPDMSDAWLPVSKGEVQHWISEEGRPLSLGYFEAWAFVPSQPLGWLLYDVTSAKMAFGGPGTDPNQIGGLQATWYPSDGAVPTAEARFRLPYAGETFSYYIGGAGGTEAGTVTSQWSEEMYATAVSFPVGIGQDFRIVRVRDGVEGTQSFSYPMQWGGMDIDAVAQFSDGGNTEDWQVLYFRSGSPSGLKVKRLADGVLTSITWYESPNGTYVYDPWTGYATWVAWYDGWAGVNVSGGWTVVTTEGVDRGQGSDFDLNWPVFAGSGQVILPRSRAGHTLKTNLGDAVTYAYPYGDLSCGSCMVPMDVYSVTLPASYAPNGGSISLVDETNGESSAGTSLSPTSLSFDLTSWYVRIPLLLKISATRWGNSLEIRSANGAVSTVGKGQVQGDWSWAPNGASSWFTSYGFFDASGEAFADVPWELVDTTRGETLQASGASGTDFTGATDNTDSDGDTLPDWYERMIGTNPNAQDTDNDGTNDNVEIANHTNPRASSVTASSNTTLRVFTPLEN